MRIDLCGVRGSMPATGGEYLRVGGDTSCVALWADADDGPCLLLDGGTGLCHVTRLLDGAPFRGSLLLTHLHWDHTQGLPFFTAGDRADARVAVHLPAEGGDPFHTLDPMLGPPFFPITAGGLRGAWSFQGLGEGPQEIEGFDVQVRAVPHPGGTTYGMRIHDGRTTVAYIPDHGPLALGPGPDGWGPYHEAVRALASGADLLLHDAEFTAEDLAAKPTFGHSAVEYAVALAEHCDVGQLLLFHHDPWRTDDAIDAFVDRWRAGPTKVSAAVQGDTIVL